MLLLEKLQAIYIYIFFIYSTGYLTGFHSLFAACRKGRKNGLVKLIKIKCRQFSDKIGGKYYCQILQVGSMF